MTDLDNRLLRDDVNQNFKISSCVIDIYLNKVSYNTATYLYKYEVKKLAISKDEWREVFAYQEKDFRITYVTKGIQEPDNGKHGLLFNVSSLENAAKNACLTITFDKSLEIGETYAFSYKCETKIDGVSNINKLFGGDGCMWYWIAHEFDCDSMEIAFHLPQNLTIKDTHPDNMSICDNTIRWVNRALSKNEFVPTLTTYEKKFLGLKPKYGKVIQVLLNMIIGALISIGITLLLT